MKNAENQPDVCWAWQPLYPCRCTKCMAGRFVPRIMVVCPTCGNKRCPKANDHENDCSGSNELGQPGSAYP